MGFVSDIVTGNAAKTGDDADKVYRVNPTGPVPAGSAITLTVWGPVATPVTPTSAPTATPSPVAPAGTVTVKWNAQTCPTGQTLAGYEIATEGGAAVITSTNPTDAETTTATITAGTEQFKVKFRYFCGQVGSEFSPTATVDVTGDPGATG
jgi:serine/threonine-protein kinase